MAPTTLLTMFNLRPELREKLAARHRLLGPLASPAGQLAGDEHAGDIRVAVTLGHIPFGAALMDALPNLGLIAVYGAGYENVDLAAAEARGVQVTNGAAGNASCVADAAMALLLAVVMRLPQADALVRGGSWDRIPPQNWRRQPGIGAKRMGIVGLGNIGSRIAVRAQAFELEIGYHNRARRSDVPHRYFSSVPELAHWADYLVVAAPGSAATQAMIDADVLRALGRGGYLINIARGSLVDQAALIAALEAGEIAGAGLDVYADEPHVSAALRSAPNTVLTPHVAGFSARAAKNLDELLLENIAAFLEGRALATKVSR